MNLRALWVTTAILAVAILLAQIAGAAARTADFGASLSAALTGDLTGTTAVEAKTHVSTETTAATSHRANLEDDEVEANVVETQPFISPSQETPVSGTAGTRPGWGCGDKNHEHTGPPGNPDATSPCDKEHGPTNSSSTTNANSNAAVNAAGNSGRGKGRVK